MRTKAGDRKKGHDDGLFKTKGRVSLRALFSGLVILTFVMTLVITLFASYRSEQQLLEERTLEANFRESERVGHGMNLLFVSISKSLTAFAGEFAEMAVLRVSSETQDELRLLYDSGGYFAEVFVAGTDGKLIGTYEGGKQGGKAMDIDPTVMNEALGAKLQFQSQPYRDVHGGMAVMVTEPIFAEEGAYLGIVGGVLHLEAPNLLGGLFGENQIDASGSYCYIVDAEGRLVYHPDQDRTGEDVSGNPAVAHLLQGHSGQEKLINTEGKRYLVGYTYVPATRWGIVVQTPTSLITAQQLEQMRGTLLVVLGPFLILAASALFLARRLAAPFVSLADFVVRAADRPQDEAMPSVRRHWNREADLLNRAVMRTVREMKRQNRDLNDFALKDPLTGLLNRRALDEILEKMEGDNRPFALLLIDIDRFKSVNDRHGHSAGDAVLRGVARTLEETVGNRDLCGRYGGEEFMVLLPGYNLPETYEMAERLRLAVAAHENELRIPVTLSIGGAVSPLQSTRIDDLFELADRALYRAKESGRDRVVV